jgi:hypothetical protein
MSRYKPMNIPISTVGYWIRGGRGQEEIFLGTKAPSEKAIKRKIAGKLLSYGGDFEPEKDKTPLDCFCRELTEESGFVADSTTTVPMARIRVYDENGFRLVLYYFLSRNWSGEAKKNTDIINPGWYPAHPLPDNILAADKFVLPLILDGMKISGMVRYDKDMNVIDKKLTAVENIE